MSTMAAKYAEINGLNLYYEEHGSQSDSVPLVLLHGGGSTIQTSFGLTIEKLARLRRVIAFDQQGHGRTEDVPERPFSFRQTASDAVQLLEYLGVDRADLMGFSNGGHIAMQIAIDYPDVVNKLVIISAMYSRAGADPRFWESFKHAKLENMPIELRTAYRQVAPDPTRLQSFFDKSVHRMDNFTDWTEDELRSIRSPALVMCGDRDILSVEHAVEMFRLIPTAQLAILPDTDHMQIMDRPEMLLPIVTPFLVSPSM